MSTTGGTAGSFHKVTPAGMTSTIGRSSLSYSANGNKLYAVVEDSASLDLNGVYRSDSGTAGRPVDADRRRRHARQRPRHRD